MGFDFKTDRLNTKAMEEGAWFKFRGGSFRIAFWNNANFTRRLNELLEPHREFLNAQHAEEADQKRAVELDREILSRAMSEHIVVGWRDVMDDGKEVPHSPETAQRYLNNPAYAEWRDWVEQTARTRGQYREARLLEVGNG